MVTRHDLSAPPWRFRLRDGLERLNTPFKHVQDAARFPFSERRFRARLQLQRQRREPIVVYSCTKTASTAIERALERHPEIEATKAHFLQPQHFWRGPLARPVASSGLLKHRSIAQQPVRDYVISAESPIRMISLVREPIGFNLSNYTYFGRAYWMRSFWRSAPWRSTDWLMSHFMQTFPHDSSSLWWEHEFKATTGIDVLSLGFDAHQGWQRYSNNRFDCLVLRADLADPEKARVLSAWLGVSELTLERENTNDSQAAPGVYERMKSSMGLHRDYVDRMLDLPASRVFFTPTQRAAIKDRWLATEGS
jgi:hypothetical protein